MKIKVIIIGAGGHSAEIDEYIEYYNFASKEKSYEIIGFIDDQPLNYSKYQFSAPYLGSIKSHLVLEDAFYIMGIANPLYRKDIILDFLRKNAKFLTFIHPTSFISKSAKIGIGCLIAPFVNVGPNVIVNDYSLLNSRCSIGHDTEIGKFNFISPNVSFSGFTKVGDNNLFGINSATIPGISVGNNNKIAAGMTLDKNVGDNEVVFYRFKEKIIATPRS